MIITKHELIRRVRLRTGSTVPETTNIVHAFLAELNLALIRHDTVQIRHWGRWHIRHKKGQNRRNPKTGNKLWVPAHFRVVFKACEKLHKLIQPVKS